MEILTRATAGVGALRYGLGGHGEFFLEGTIARTDTVAKNLFTLPAGAIPIRVETSGLVVSNAVTTATLDIGKTGTDNFFVAAADVKAANFGDAAIVRAMKQSTPLVAGIQVVGKYSETGGASSAGGPWTVRLFYRQAGN